MIGAPPTWPVPPHCLRARDLAIPPSGVRVAVAGIVSTPTAVRVRRADRVPEDGAICTQVMTSPAQLVTLPQSALPVTFVTDAPPAGP